MSATDPEHPERELEEWLRRVPPESSDAARRAQARWAFLGAGLARMGEPSHAGVPGRTGSVMPEGAHDEERDGFAAWLAARAPATPPPPDVRRRARLAFLTAVAATPPPLRERRSFRRSVWALAAAAILAVTFLLPDPERWSVRLDGRLRCDGVEFLPGDEERLAAALEGSGTVETELARARFQLGGGFVLELLPDSALAFPFQPGLDGVEPLEFELTRGEAYLRTSAAYPGNPIVVRTALADVTLHGTTVGVRTDAQGTCVCVADGTARVTSARLARGFQDVGARSILLFDSAPAVAARTEAFPAEGPAESAHTADLVAFQQGP